MEHLGARREPQAKAYTLLKELGLDCGLNRPGEKAGRINFVEGDYHPGSCERCVELRNDLCIHPPDSAD